MMYRNIELFFLNPAKILKKKVQIIGKPHSYLLPQRRCFEERYKKSEIL